jgi:hypothetical protein
MSVVMARSQAAVPCQPLEIMHHRARVHPPYSHCGCDLAAVTTRGPWDVPGVKGNV